jgi:type IV secretory pathway TrbD component
MADLGDRAAVVPGERERPQIVFLEAARVMMLFGAVTAVRSFSVSGRATQAFLGLVLWLLGVCLLALVPVAGRFPRTALAAAEAILKNFFSTLWN